MKETTLTLDQALKNALVTINDLLKPVATIKPVIMDRTDVHSYLYKNDKGNMCVITIPCGFSRKVITVANAKKSIGVDVPKFSEGDVYAFLCDYIPIALDRLETKPGDMADTIRTALRGVTL